jgi:hypothetical protein
MNLRLIRSTVFVGVVCACLNSFAETPPPVSPFDAITWEPTLKARPSSGIRMGSFRVRFEKTTLDEVRHAASIGDIAHRGDAGESTYWLCYTNVALTRVERIWIIASEMGGSKHHVSHISAELVPEEGATRDCPALPDKMKPLSLESGLWLNASESNARKRLGRPSYKKGPWQSFDYQSKIPGNCEGGGFDFLNWVLLRFDGGRVNTVHAGQVTSC